MKESLSIPQFQQIIDGIVATLRLTNAVMVGPVENPGRGPSCTINVDGVEFSAGNFWPFDKVEFGVYMREMPLYCEGFKSFESAITTNPAYMAKRIIGKLPEAQAWINDNLTRLAAQKKVAADREALQKHVEAITDGKVRFYHGGNNASGNLTSRVYVDLRMSADHVDSFKIDSMLSNTQLDRLIEFLKTL